MAQSYVLELAIMGVVLYSILESSPVSALVTQCVQCGQIGTGPCEDPNLVPTDCPLIIDYDGKILTFTSCRTHVIVTTFNDSVVWEQLIKSCALPQDEHQAAGDSLRRHVQRKDERCFHTLIHFQNDVLCRNGRHEIYWHFSCFCDSNGCNKKEDNTPDTSIVQNKWIKEMNFKCPSVSQCVQCDPCTEHDINSTDCPLRTILPEEMRFYDNSPSSSIYNECATRIKYDGSLKKYCEIHHHSRDLCDNDIDEGLRFCYCDTNGCNDEETDELWIPDPPLNISAIINYTRNENDTNAIRNRKNNSSSFTTNYLIILIVSLSNIILYVKHHILEF